jgi:membrane protein implicated in regulation of membrane protease activity
MPVLFAPWIDLPLSVITLFAFLLHFNSWAHSKPADVTVDLKARLPKARFRVVSLVLASVLLCWCVNLSVWSLYALLVVFGLAISLVLSSGNGEGSGLLVLLVAYAIREWAFGFPHLVLHPPSESSMEGIQTNEDLIGESGIVESPLRPFGDATIAGRTISVVSENGQLVEAGTTVVVCGTQNGKVLVRPSDNSDTA